MKRAGRIAEAARLSWPGVLALLVLPTFAFAMWAIAEGEHAPAATLIDRTFGLAVGRATGSAAAVPLGIARVTLPLVAWGALLGLVWRVIRNSVRLWLAAHRSGHLVVAGDPRIVAPIVEGERRQGSASVVLTARPRPAWIARAAEHGAAVLTRNDDIGGERVDRVLRGARLVVLSGEDADDNAALAGALARADAAHNRRGESLPVMVRVDDLSMRDRLEDQLEAIGCGDAVQFRLVSMPNLIARALFHTNVFDRVVRTGAQHRTLVIIGYTAIMQHYLLQVLTGACFGDGRGMDVVVIDPAADACHARLLADWPTVAQLAPVRFVTGRIDDPTTLDLILDLAPVAVVVDLEGDACTASIAAIDARYSIADTPPPAYAIHLLDARPVDIAAPLAVYGGATMQIHAELMGEVRHETLARAVHDFYLEGRLDEGEALGSRAAVEVWEHLPEALRDDNRSVIDSYDLKLRTIGARVETGRGVPLVLEAEEIAAMARAEHDRWTAARLLAGWRHGPDRDEQARLHPDLVPYEELSAATRERDRAQVRIIARLLARVGGHAVRDLRVLVEPGARPRLTAGLAAFQRAHANRHLVLLGNGDDPDVRATLLAAHEAGVTVQLGIARHPRGWRGSGAQVTRLHAMLRTADRVYVPGKGGNVAALLEPLAHVRLADALA